LGGSGAGLYQFSIAPVKPDGESSGDLNITAPVTIQGVGGVAWAADHACGALTRS